MTARIDDVLTCMRLLRLLDEYKRTAAPTNEVEQRQAESTIALMQQRISSYKAGILSYDLIMTLSKCIKSGTVLLATYGQEQISAGPYQTATGGKRYACIVGANTFIHSYRSPHHVAQVFFSFIGFHGAFNAIAHALRDEPTTLEDTETRRKGDTVAA